MQEPNSKLVDAMWVGLFNVPMNAFYAPLACSLNFKWTEEQPTAAVDGETIFFNPRFFEKITPDQRLFTLMHEVDHVARLHHIRMGNRDPEVWNQACDYEINNALIKSVNPKTGRLLYNLEGFDILINKDYDDLSAEQIYDLLIQNQPPNQPNDLGQDLKPVSAEAKDDVPHGDIIQKVVNAKTVADQAKKNASGNSPGYLEELISTFSRPYISWTKYLTRFMTELGSDDYTWQRRNIRYQDVYIPALAPVEGLAHIVFFYDISGSVTHDQITRFNTEVAHVHRFFNPEKLTVVTFDTKIRDIFSFSKDDVLKDIKITGRGGTSLEEVYAYLIKHKPTAAVVFSDLECYPINDPKIPIFWGIIGNHMVFNPPFGTKIHIPSEKDK